MWRVSSAAASDPGLRRELNEDSYCIRPDLGLYVVADGMGGHTAGEVASRLAVEAIERFIEETKDSSRTWPLPFDPRLSTDGNRLGTALRLANRRLAAAVERDASLKGMATTAAALLATSTGFVVAHVGDSRVYRSRGGRLEQVTHDHSWVSEQVRAGSLSESDARHHPWRNVVTRAIAGGDDPEVDVAEVDVREGDLLMICSDGLSGVVSNEECQAILDTAPSLEEACRQLVAAANARGGPDNITVALLKIDVA
jgi:serine/threonine protein phosphatase PrpC